MDRDMHVATALDRIRETQLQQGAELRAMARTLDQLARVLKRNPPPPPPVTPWSAIWNGLFRPGAQGGLKWLGAIGVIIYLLRGGDLESALKLFGGLLQ